MKHELFPADELEPGDMRVVQVDRIALVVLRTPSGRFHALRDVCPHYGARLSLGRLKPYMVEGTTSMTYRHEPDQFVLHCPWHQYEYRVEDGRCPADPTRLRVRVYDVTVEDGMVYVER